MTPESPNKSPQLDAATVMEMCATFHCSERSVSRSFQRHPDKPAELVEELRAKASEPCWLFNFSARHAELAKSLTRLPFMCGVFPGASPEQLESIRRALMTAGRKPSATSTSSVLEQEQENNAEKDNAGDGGDEGQPSMDPHPACASPCASPSESLEEIGLRAGPPQLRSLTRSSPNGINAGAATTTAAMAKKNDEGEGQDEGEGAQHRRVQAVEGERRDSGEREVSQVPHGVNDDDDEEEEVMLDEATRRTVEALKRHFRPLAPWWRSSTGMPFHIISITIPDNSCQSESVFEERYQEIVVAEEIRHLVGILTIDDNHMPFIDYCNERIWGARAEMLMTRFSREKPLIDSLLFDASLTAERQASIMNQLWSHEDELHWLNFLGRHPSTSIFRRHKYLAQRRLAHCGLDHIRSVLADNFGQAVVGMQRAGLEFPVVCKPACGEANILVTLCDGPDMLMRQFNLAEQQNFTRCFNNRTFVIEEYIEGDEYVVNTVSLKGKTVVTEVWRSYKRPKTTRSHRLTVSEGQSLLNAGAPIVYLETTSLVYDYQMLENNPMSSPVKELMDYTIQVVQALGMYNGASHCELRLDQRPNSPKFGRPVLIELNPRVQGSTPRSLPLVWYSQLSLLLYSTAVATLAIQQHELVNHPSPSRSRSSSSSHSNNNNNNNTPPGENTATTGPSSWSSGSLATRIVLEGGETPSLMSGVADRVAALARSSAPMTMDNLPWPITPVFYHTTQMHLPEEKQRRRSVLFLDSPLVGVMSLRGLKRLSFLSTFCEFSRISPSVFNERAVPRVTVTTDLFTSPGAIVMEGPLADLERDRHFIRAFESAKWSPEIVKVLQLLTGDGRVVMDREHYTEARDMLQGMLMHEHILYLDEKYLPFFSVSGVFNSMLAIPGF